MRDGSASVAIPDAPALQSPFPELQRPVEIVDDDVVAADELALQDLLRERVLELALDRALERPRAVDRIEADVAEQVEGAVADLELDAELGQALCQMPGLDARDAADVFATERMEDHEFV